MDLAVDGGILFLDRGVGMEALHWNPEVTLALSVSDRTLSVDWYTRVLGCTPEFSVDVLGFTQLKTPLPGLSIVLVERLDATPGGFVPTITVADLHTERDRLQALGVRFEADTVVHAGMVKLATFFDPDGHALMLAEDLAGS